ncbi:glycosyltransferase [Paenibacillus thermotolerans]|uniref:glycosyltransferase n=1 Tax=Paenibacillus thermotolerans TaxID=3027807 RepID=UPI0023675833|nr:MULTISPECIES: glycosyltransferase [unclassified Paenibacillus]
MKVLHLPLEVAGQVREMCKQLTLHGIQSVGYNWRNSYFGYDDYVIQSDAYEMANALECAISYFDIFHYHTGYTIFKDKSDVLMALDAGKKVVMHHRGNDVRLPSKAKKLNPYVYTGDSQPEEQIKKNLEFFSKHLKAAIVQDYELYDYVCDYYQNVYVLPRLINTKEMLPRYETEKSHPPLIVHAPTSKLFKGTEEIIKVVKALQQEIKFDFKLVELSTRSETLNWFQKADIIIDQILCGAYGNVSVEGMALGKPVVCYLRQDIQTRLPRELPIISANPDTLYGKLKYLVQHSEYRRQKGKEGRAYVEKYHESSRVIRDLIDIYRSL